MTAQKLFVVKQTQISQADRECVIETLCEGRPGETCDDLVTRFLQQKYPPPPAIARPIAPEIPLMLPSDVPCPKYDPATVEAASKFEGEWERVFKSQWLNLSGAEALDGLFAPDDLIMMSGSSAGVPVVYAFNELPREVEAFQSICINPIVGPRFRV